MEDLWVSSTDLGRSLPTVRFGTRRIGESSFGCSFYGLQFCKRAVELSGCFNEVLFLPEDKGSVVLRVLWSYSSYGNIKRTL